MIEGMSFEEYDKSVDQDQTIYYGKSGRELNSSVETVSCQYKDAPIHVKEMFFQYYQKMNNQLKWQKKQ